MKKSLYVLAFVLVGMAGCQKLNFETTVDVPFGTAKRLNFTAPAYNQNVEATIEPQDADVSISAYLVKESDADAVENALGPGKAPPANLVLDGKTFKPSDSRQNFTLKATVPAKTPYVLILNGGKKTSKAKVKVVGR